MKKILIIAFILIISLSMPASAFKMSGSTYKLYGELVYGGGETSSANYKLTGAIAQPFTGSLTTSNYQLCLGIYCIAVPIKVYDFYLSGNLLFNNESLKNKNVQLEISFPPYSKTISNKTDSEGNFVFHMTNVPKALAEEEFHVLITAFGEITAIYECVYDSDTDTCEYYPYG